MRELRADELDQASGGFEGTPIPFTNSFISGPNFPGGFPAAIPMLIAAYNAGEAVGEMINEFNQEQFGMSTGTALYKTLNDSAIAS
jgi:hypothetical protein